MLDRLGIAPEEDDFHFNPEGGRRRPWRREIRVAMTTRKRRRTAFAAAANPAAARNYANKPDHAEEHGRWRAGNPPRRRNGRASSPCARSLRKGRDRARALSLLKDAAATPVPAPAPGPFRRGDTARTLWQRDGAHVGTDGGGSASSAAGTGTCYERLHLPLRDHTRKLGKGPTQVSNTTSLCDMQLLKCGRTNHHTNRCKISNLPPKDRSNATGLKTLLGMNPKKLHMIKQSAQEEDSSEASVHAVV